MKILVRNYNSVIPDLSSRFEMTDSLDAADAVVLWNEVVSPEMDIGLICKQRGIPFYVAAHGWCHPGVPTEYGQYKARCRAEKVFVWSEAARDAFVRDGVSPEKIVITGCPFNSFRRPSLKDGKSVLFVPSHAEEDQKLNKANAAESREVWGILNAIPGIRPVIKLLEGEHFAKNMAGEVFTTDRTKSSHVEQIYQRLESVSCVVLQDEGTFAAIAYSMDIPVVKLSNNYERATGACAMATPVSLAETVRYALDNPDFKQAERRSVAESAGFNDLRPVDIFAETILSKQAALA